MALSAEPTVTELLQRAEGLSKLRAEPLTGVHLLAALGAATGSARDLLEERGAGFRRVLDRWEGMLDRGRTDNLDLIVRSTQAMARRFGVRVATAPHLLLALLGDSAGSVRRVLDAMEVDVSALRQAALQLAQGLPTRRSRAAEAVVPLPRHGGARHAHRAREGPFRWPRTQRLRPRGRPGRTPRGHGQGITARARSGTRRARVAPSAAHAAGPLWPQPGAVSPHARSARFACHAASPEDGERGR
jgi:hypothetical protein